MQSLTPRPEDALAAPAADAEGDELAKYLALAQEKLKKKATEEEDGPDPVLERGGKWRQKGTKVPRNVAVMARQYLGCPASSATVERLFSAAGISFGKAQQRGKADTRESIAFAHANDVDRTHRAWSTS